MNESCRQALTFDATCVQVGLKCSGGLMLSNELSADPCQENMHVQYFSSSLDWCPSLLQQQKPYQAL